MGCCGGVWLLACGCWLLTLHDSLGHQQENDRSKLIAKWPLLSERPSGKEDNRPPLLDQDGGHHARVLSQLLMIYPRWLEERGLWPQKPIATPFTHRGNIMWPSWAVEAGRSWRECEGVSVGTDQGDEAIRNNGQGERANTSTNQGDGTSRSSLNQNVGGSMNSGQGDGAIMNSGQGEGDIMNSGQGEGDIMNSGQDDGAIMNSGQDDGAIMNSGQDDGAIMNSGQDDGAIMNSGQDDGSIRNSGQDDGSIRNSGQGDGSIRNSGQGDGEGWPWAGPGQPRHKTTKRGIGLFSLAYALAQKPIRPPRPMLNPVDFSAYQRRARFFMATKG
ncbi:uncharacterized protein [Procambarus clarkii]|uniref:uncharacterized protein n=1 Tax=Procambarus clarkii TaxID=6728 RepID=UPI0037420ACB